MKQLFERKHRVRLFQAVFQRAKPNKKREQEKSGLFRLAKLIARACVSNAGLIIVMVEAAIGHIGSRAPPRISRLLAAAAAAATKTTTTTSAYSGKGRDPSVTTATITIQRAWRQYVCNKNRRGNNAAASDGMSSRRLRSIMAGSADDEAVAVDVAIANKVLLAYDDAKQMRRQAQGPLLSSATDRRSEGVPLLLLLLGARSLCYHHHHHHHLVYSYPSAFSCLRFSTC